MDMLQNILNSEANLEDVEKERAEKEYERKRIPVNIHNELVEKFMKTHEPEDLQNVFKFYSKYYALKPLEDFARDYEKKIKETKKKLKKNVDIKQAQRILHGIKRRIDRIKMPKSISACMIVKNEAYLIRDRQDQPKHINLRACIASFINQVDELIICDTGSSDRTIKVIQTLQKKYPKIKLYQDEWVGYATNRRKSIERATKDYVFIIDADERWAGIKSIKQIVMQSILSGGESIKVWQHNYNKGNKGLVGSTNFRLIPRENITISNEKHNQIEGVFKMVLNEYGIIEHHGYDQELQHRQEKQRTDYKENFIEYLRHKKRGDISSATYYRYKCGESLGVTGQTEHALKVLLQCVETIDTVRKQIALQIYTNICKCYGKLNMLKDMEIYARKMVELDNEDADGHYYLAIATSDYIHAKSYFIAVANTKLKDEHYTDFAGEVGKYKNCAAIMIKAVSDGVAQYSELSVIPCNYDLGQEITDEIIRLGINGNQALLHEFMVSFYKAHKKMCYANNLIISAAQLRKKIDESLIVDIKKTFSTVFIIWESLAHYYYHIGDSEQCDICIKTAEGVKSEHTKADIRTEKVEFNRATGEDIHAVTEP